jgi:hypothetical protein
MKKLIYSKIIPYLIFLLLMLWYFAPELNLVGLSLGNAIRNKCIISSIVNPSCSVLEVEIAEPVQIGLNLPRTPKFVFLTNRKSSELNLQTSHIEILGSYQIDPNENQIIGNIKAIFGNLAVIKDYSLNSENVQIKELGDFTQISLQSETLPEDASTFIVRAFVDDNSGNTGFNWIYNSTSPDIYGYILARISYLLQYLIWFFAIFGAAIKGISLSIVYDSETKEPLSGAIIRIFSQGKLIKTLVSNSTGVILFRPLKGKYRIEVIKPGYLYPSKLYPQLIDQNYKNLYYGSEIEVTKDNEVLKLNIPLDPENTKINSGFIRKSASAFVSTLDLMNPYMVASIAIIQIIIWPTYLETYVFAAVAAVLIGLQIFNRKRVEGAAGLVIDTYGNPVADARVELYDTEWNKIAEIAVTDSKGEYEFIVPMKNYYLKVVKNGYVMSGIKSDENLLVSLEKQSGRTLRINQKIVLEKVTE